MAAMHPNFLRLPGGNYLEGDHIADRYQWKEHHRPLGRPAHAPQPLALPVLGRMGLLEYLEWCEDLEIVASIGGLRRLLDGQEHIDPGPALEPYVLDVWTRFEYVTGGPG